MGSPTLKALRRPAVKYIKLLAFFFFFKSFSHRIFRSHLTAFHFIVLIEKPTVRLLPCRGFWCPPACLSATGLGCWGFSFPRGAVCPPAHSTCPCESSDLCFFVLFRLFKSILF